MSIVKVIEIHSEGNSIEAAAESAVSEAAKTVKEKAAPRSAAGLGSGLTERLVPARLGKGDILGRSPFSALVSFA